MAPHEDIALIESPIELPNGVVVPNRLVKAAMAEGIGLGGGPPRSGHINLYRRWAAGGWGVILSGNVQVDPRHLASPHDLTMSLSPSTLEAFSNLASAVHTVSPSTLLLMQISHPGLQSSSTMNFSRYPWEPALAPCEARPDLSGGLLGSIMGHLVWPRKSRMIDTAEEWLGLVEAFVQAATVAEQAGWDGVQVHSAHGYLLAEYLSPLTNPAPIPLPGVPSHLPARLHLLYLILTGIKRRTHHSFIRAVKLNCSDFVQGGLDEAQASEIIKSLVSWNLVDMVEISGGTYAQPAFASPDTLQPSTSSMISPRQSLFAHFTTSLLPHLEAPPTGPAIILTGGLHDRTLIASSINERACDLVGIGRPGCLIPDIPRRIMLNPDILSDATSISDYTIPGANLIKGLLGGSSSGVTKGVPLVGAGVSTLWHEWQLCRMGRGLEPNDGMHWLRGLMVEELWWEVLRGGPVAWWQAMRGGKIRDE
ncbi:hypothetical protein IAU60_002746 [Kwoniella sp. DSM 27419]